MKFYTPQAWTGTAEGADVAFETTDLDGNPVNSAQLFSQNKITMINIWATTCGPCIEEMPELEKMNQEFQKKGGAIVGDPILGAHLDKYKEIMEKYLSEAE